ncbi:hypothetical protein DF156_30730 [Burkholderia ubonensis]|nr:hypothetical protein DF155_30210 [Burkholderia ubonensis]RQP30004.1 hypothetical protein DF154_31750 [Burkholderia ubonensis]RQP31936.1 hypothetical protein DF156_30730 [Burkholderia ubonensis]RQP48028.1 hypothetical protein DF144_30135 [Burkholderia ubonensis]RQP50981.1 hypothetical protein DF151_30330 [Burkholderia ubonensis]
MFKVPRHVYTAEFKQAAVQRVKDGQDEPGDCLIERAFVERQAATSAPARRASARAAAARAIARHAPARTGVRASRPAAAAARACRPAAGRPSRTP